MLKENLIEIPIEKGNLVGNLYLSEEGSGLVVFAHGSGSGRMSPRNRYVAEILQQGGLSTLLIDLLTIEEEKEDEETSRLRFDIPLLARRLIQITDWLLKQPKIKSHQIGYFGASTGAAAALMAAAERPQKIHAVVSRGGRPDLAKPKLFLVKAPTLLIVGGDDRAVIGMNEEALDQLSCIKRMVIIPGATHLFEEPGTLAQVAQLARDWFQNHLKFQKGA